MIKFLAISEIEPELNQIYSIVCSADQEISNWIAPDFTLGFTTWKKHCPDVILADLRTNLSRALEFCLKIKSEAGVKPFYCIGLVSSHMETHSIQAARQSGIDAFIFAPVNGLELISMIGLMYKLKSSENLLKSHTGHIETNSFNNSLEPKSEPKKRERVHSPDKGHSKESLIQQLSDYSGETHNDNFTHQPGVHPSALQHLHAKIADAINKNSNQQELFDLVRDELSQFFDTNNFIFAQLDEFTGLLTAPYEKDQYGAIPPAWSAENSLTGFVIRHKRSLFIKKDEIVALAEAGEIVLRGKRAEVWLGVPLKINDKVKSAIVIQSYDNPNAYDKTSVELLESVAHQLSSFYEKQRTEENELKLSKALIQSPVSIIITKLSGEIEYVNQRFCDISGYAENELTGKNPRILQSGETPPEVYQQLWSTISIGGEWRGELLNKKKNGELFWESVSITPIFDSAGIMCNYLAVKEDITERKHSIAMLEEAKQKAETGDRLKSAFLENISHEIRTPLNGILGFAPLVLDPKVSQKDKEEYLSILNASGKRLLQTVNDYMDISLLVSGNIKVLPKLFNIKSFITDIAMAFVDRCEAKSIDFKLIFDPALNDKVVRCDRELLKKVFFHLLDNAVKFTDQGSISIECSTEAGVLKFSVNDTGIGIESAHIQNIFEKFFQEDHKRTRNFEGSGLGLTIVAEIMKLLEGSVSVKSTKFSGSEFILQLPDRT